MQFLAECFCIIFQMHFSRDDRGNGVGDGSHFLCQAAVLSGGIFPGAPASA